MLQLALKLAGLSVNALKTLGRAIKMGLLSAAGVANFPTPKITPAELEAGVKAVEDQEAMVGAVEGDLEEQRRILQEKITTLESLVTGAATDCLNTVSQLPEAEAKMAMASANVPLRGDREPSPVAQVPTGFFVNRGDHDQEVDGGCDRQAAGKMYRARYSATPTGPWTMGYEGTKSSFTIPNVPVGECWFEMAVFATNGGWSEWCAPMRCHVL